MVFSHNVSIEIRNFFHKELEVQTVNVHSKYLGLPLCVGHNKTELFRFMVEKTWQKVMGWKEKMLSAAGKEIFINRFSKPSLNM